MPRLGSLPLVHPSIRVRRSLTLLLLAALTASGLSIAAAPAGAVVRLAPPLVGDWTFAGGEALESTGLWSSFTMHGDATIDGDQLVVTGNGDLNGGNGENAATGWADASGYTGPPITDKTLVSWVKLDDAEVRSGSPISLYSHEQGDIFDAVDYAEYTPHEWMQGSEGGFRNTTGFQPGHADTDTTNVRQIAISYRANGDGSQTVTGCLNGGQLGSFVTGASPTFGETSQALFGPRHQSSVPDEAFPEFSTLVPVGSISAHITESRIYGAALSCGELAALSPQPAPTAPWVPRAVTATPGNASATVSFTTPGFDGGSPITGYTVTATDATNQARGGQTATGTGSPITVTGLTNADSYTFTVHATNSVGDSAESAPSEAVTPSRITAQPSDNPAQDSVSVFGTFDPAEGGPATVSGTATDRTNVSVESGPVDVDSETGAYRLEFDLTTLAEGPISVTVTGTDSDDGTATATTSLTHNDAPHALAVITTDFVNSSNQHAVTVDVTSSDSDTSTVTVYIRDSSENDKTPSQTVSFTASDPSTKTLTFDVSDLADGAIAPEGTATDALGQTDVVARNSVSKDASIPAVTTKIEQDPITPANESAVHVTGTYDSTGEVTVELALTDDLGNSIESAADAPGNSGTYEHVFDTSTLTGTTITATATVQNRTSRNSSTATDTATRSDTNPGAPSVPLNVTATQSGPGQVTITWQAPASPGTSAITGYGAGYGNGGSGDGDGFGADVRSATFTGLANGSYTASVNANNASGDGPRASTPFTIASAQAPQPAPVVQPTSASPGPSASSAAPTRRPLTLSVRNPLIRAGGSTVLTATGEPNQAYQLRCYTRPSTTYSNAREGAFNAAGDPVDFTLRLGRNTRCYIQYADNSSQGASGSVVVAVRTVLSVSAIRTGPLRYVFIGRNLPRVGGQLITLYRVDNAGNEIRTANLVTDDSGRYRVTRTFTEGGTFAFRVRTSNTLNNVPGASRTVTLNLH
jgi:hypothetical protein